MRLRLLELFSGTGSVAKVAREKGWEVISVDIDPESAATHISDILYWDFTQYPHTHFDIIWSSPPCTEYSTVMNRRPRKLAEADSIVQRTLDIIMFFCPTYWFIENPRDGMLKYREFMRDLPYIDVSYCRYGFDYRKHTRIWSNVHYDNPLVCKGDCGKIMNGKHLGLVSETRSLNQKHSMPPLLVEYLLNACG